MNLLLHLEVFLPATRALVNYVIIAICLLLLIVQESSSKCQKDHGEEDNQKLARSNPVESGRAIVAYGIVHDLSVQSIPVATRKEFHKIVGGSQLARGSAQGDRCGLHSFRSRVAGNGNNIGKVLRR